MQGLLLATLGMCVIVAARYLLTSGMFAALTLRAAPSVLRPADPAKRSRLRAQIRREIGWSLLSAAVYGIPAGIVAWGWLHRGWTKLYTDASAYPLWWLPASVLLYLFVHDAWFYWTHRAMHASGRLFRAMHAVHHRSRPPTAWAAMAFHPYEALSAAWLYPVLVFLVPIHIGALGVVMLVATVMAVTNHMGWEAFPRAWVHGRFGRHAITASHHALHHHDYGANFGLYWRGWDRLCGTDKGLVEGGLATTATARQTASATSSTA